MIRRLVTARLATIPRALILLAALIIVWPVLIIPMPPLVDYPNHVVRFWLLGGGANLSPLSTYFRVDWTHTATNIAMDALARALTTLFSAPVTGRIILALSALLPVVGMVLVSHKLFGKLSFWHILLGLNAWGLLLLTGLMSFQLSLGAALIALWLDMIFAGQMRYQRWLRQTMQALIILLIHPFGAAFYLALMTALCVGPARALITPKLWPEILKRLAEGWLPLLLAGALISLRMAPHAATGPIPLFWQDDAFSLSHMLEATITPWRSYNLPVDLIFVVLLALPVAVSFYQRRLMIHSGLLAAGAALFGLSLLCPQEVNSTSLVDVRLSTMAALILTLAVCPELRFRKYTTAILCTFALVALGARSAWLGDIWYQRQADVDSLNRALDYVPEGARVLPVTVSVADEDTEPLGRYLGGMTTTFGHLPTLAVMRRHAYVPTVFAETGKQPLSVREPFVAHHEVSGGLLGTLADLRSGNAKVAGYLPYAQTEFDYILIVNADMNPTDNRIDADICLITDQGFAKLYRVLKPNTVCES